MNRRVFLASGAATAAGLGIGQAPVVYGGEVSKRPVYRENAREIPVVEHADVVVCGGGPAGIAAAVAAARAGATTRLLEVGGCLGGIWTSGLMSWVLDAGNKTGLMREVLSGLKSKGAMAKYGGSFACDVEQMKLFVETMCLEAGVRIQLHTRIVAAAKPDGRRLELAVTESKSGRQAWSGEVFVDATGDGDLSASAGCGFDYGRAGTGEVQPMSMIALLTGIEPDDVRPFVRGLSRDRGGGGPKRRLLAEMKRAGVVPSYAQPTLFYFGRGLFCLMANHEYGVSALDAAQITEATLRSRAEVHKLVDALRVLGGVWKHLSLVATSEQIGVREGRRIHGRYRVTSDDLRQGRSHDDAVCRVRFPVDVHSTDPKKCQGIMDERVRAKPYDIPYRALTVRDVDNLLMAGRCISGDFLAHSSYRVTGNAVAMGQAAGAAAAIAARTKRLPHEIPWPEVRDRIQ